MRNCSNIIEIKWKCPRCKTENKHRIVKIKGVTQFLVCKKCKYKKAFRSNEIATLDMFFEEIGGD